MTPAPLTRLVDLLGATGQVCVQSARQAAQDLLEWAAAPAGQSMPWRDWASTKGPDTVGVPSLSERAETVTEGRNGLSVKQGWKHSSCGDLVHFMLAQLGVRSRFVNRAHLEDGRHPGYRIGANLSAIMNHPEFVHVRNFDGVELQVGDVIMIGHGVRGHVEVVLSHDRDAGRMCVATYGQDMSKTSTDGCIRRYDCRGPMIRGGRKAVGYLPLIPVLERAARDDELGCALLPETADDRG